MVSGGIEWHGQEGAEAGRRRKLGNLSVSARETTGGKAVIQDDEVHTENEELTKKRVKKAVRHKKIYGTRGSGSGHNKNVSSSSLAVPKSSSPAVPDSSSSAAPDSSGKKRKLPKTPLKKMSRPRLISPSSGRKARVGKDKKNRPFCPSVRSRSRAVLPQPVQPHQSGRDTLGLMQISTQRLTS